MSELRKRPVAASVRSNPAAEAAAAPDPMPAAKKIGGCPVQANGTYYYYVRKAVVILFPAYILCCMFEVLEPPRQMMEHTWDAAIEAIGKGPRIFSAAELEAQGVGHRPLLSILGEVFDVSGNRKHYAKGGVHEGFTGKDATRAFVTADFTEEGLTDDVSGLTPSQCLGLKDWHSFYVKDDKYRKRGILAGRFYDAEGNPTRELAEFEECVRKGREEKERDAAEKKLYPSCYSRWAAAEGGRVWCEDPKKVPRKFRPEDLHGVDIRIQGPREESPGKQQSEARRDEEGEAGSSWDAAKVKGRCNCLDVDYARANEDRLLSYGGCALDSNSCVTKPPETPNPKRK